MTKDRYPYVFSGRSITVDRIDLLVRLSEGSDVEDVGTNIKFTLVIPRESDPDEPTLIGYDLPAAPNLGEALHIPRKEDIHGTPIVDSPGEWTLTVGDLASTQPPRLNPDAVEDIGLIVHYKVG